MTERFAHSPAGPRELPSGLRQSLSPERQGQQLQSLSERIQDEKLRYAVEQGRNPAAFEQEFLSDIGPDGGMIGRMEQVSATYRPQIDGENGIRRRLLQALNAPAVYETTLEGIMDGLTTVPSSADDTVQRHRYLSGRRVSAKDDESDPSVIYDTNFQQIDKDRQFLEELTATYPQHAGDLQVLSGALEELARQDKRYDVFRYQQGKVSFTDDAAKHFGKTTLFVVASAAAVITGLMAWRGNKSFTAPLLYAAVAALIASPKLRRTLFKGKMENTLVETNGVLNDESFKKMSHDYGIKGPVWRDIAETIMGNDNDTRQIIKLLEKHPTNKEGISTQIDDYVNGMVAGQNPEAVQIRQNFRRLIEDGYLPWLALKLQNAKSLDAKEVAGGVVAGGAAGIF